MVRRAATSASASWPRRCVPPPRRSASSSRQDSGAVRVQPGGDRRLEDRREPQRELRKMADLVEDGGREVRAAPEELCLLGQSILRPEELQVAVAIEHGHVDLRKLLGVELERREDRL